MKYSLPFLNTWPFSSLSTHTKQEIDLLPSLFYRITLKKEERLKNQNCIYFLEKGELARYLYKDNEPRYLQTLPHSSLIGLQEILLNVPHHETLIATQNTDLYCIPREQLQKIMRENPSFAQTIAQTLHQRFPLFDGIKHFMFALEQACRNKRIHIEELIPIYKNMSPALHPHVHDKKIDFGAWSYAKNRLPKDVLSCYVFLLSTEIPSLIAPISDHLESIQTRYRRRIIKKISEGKSLVIVRDAHTDLIDFVSNLCVHYIESQKLRRMLHQKGLLPILFGNKDEISEQLTTHLGAIWTNFQQLGFDDPIQRICELALHHEDYTLYIEESEHQYNKNTMETWIQNIHTKCCEIFGSIDDVHVDIISSNRFVARYCLSPELHNHIEEIQKWGEEHISTIDPKHF